MIFSILLLIIYNIFFWSSLILYSYNYNKKIFIDSKIFDDIITKNKDVKIIRSIEKNSFNYRTKEIKIMNNNYNLKDLFILIHEIGHFIDSKNNPYMYRIYLIFKYLCINFLLIFIIILLYIIAKNYDFLIINVLLICLSVLYNFKCIFLYIIELRASVIGINSLKEYDISDDCYSILNKLKIYNSIYQVTLNVSFFFITLISVLLFY